jgi:hypothetical protein
MVTTGRAVLVKTGLIALYVAIASVHQSYLRSARVL